MTKLITFTDDNMTISANKLVASYQRICGQVPYSIWTPRDLSEEFRETMAGILKHAHGAGYYCWKPYIVHREMCRLQNGDVLIYCDAGNEWIADPRLAINAMDEDIMFFSNGFKHLQWCKGDCWRTILAGYDMGGESAGFIQMQEQVQASTFFIRLTPTTRQLVQEWYGWSLIPGMIDNEPSRSYNVPTFREHRWDQSILCCLQIKYGYRLHWFPTTTAGHLKRLYPNDKYPTLLNHHRKRNHEWT